MTTKHSALTRTAVALAVLAALGSAHAQAPAGDAKPAKVAPEAAAGEVEAWASVGVGWASGNKDDRAFFGQYNGLRDQSVYGLVDFAYTRRREADGTLVSLIGTSLGLQTRELGLLWQRQGDWRFSADYGELIRRDPYTVNTGIAGAGSTAPQVVYLTGGVGSGADYDPKTKRESLGLGFSKWFGTELELVAGVKSENKQGSSFWGIGFNCPAVSAPGCAPTTAISTSSAVLFLPQPIDSNHTQVDLRLNYLGDRLRVSGGYYGSFYNNQYGTVNPGVPASLNNQVGTLLPLSSGLQSILANPVALPPDNQLHNFDVAGNYRFTPTTIGNFKLAYSTARQDQDFAGSGLAYAPAGVGNLDGRFDTTLAQVGLSARPLPRLTLTAEGRYQDRDDKTPIALYNTVGSATYTNRSYDLERINGKLRAAWQFTAAVQGVVGFDYESIDRGVFTPSSAVGGVSALRQDTDESTWRAELRGRLTETLGGELRWRRADRDGSNWLRPNSGLGVTEITDPATGFAPTAIFSPTLADRTRDLVEVTATWQATEALMIQFAGSGGKDEYSAPTGYALRDSKVQLYTVDANYAVSESWNVNAFASYGRQKYNQARPAGAILEFDNTNTTVGIGASGRIGAKLEFGGTLSYINDDNAYAQTLDPLAPPAEAALLAAAGGLPDIVFRQTELRLFGKYALAERSALRLDAVYQNTRYDDWSHLYGSTPYRYGDNSTISVSPDQSVFFLGVSYVYRWR
jgi:MtrB/PioB family decaheme-associated outer membrane protein